MNRIRGRPGRPGRRLPRPHSPAPRRIIAGAISLTWITAAAVCVPRPGTVVSRAAFNLLARGDEAPFDPPRTAGEVVELCQQRRLGAIGGLGPRRIGEIEASLIYAGLIIRQLPPSASR